MVFLICSGGRMHMNFVKEEAKIIPQCRLRLLDLFKILNSDSFNFLCSLSDEPVCQYKLGWQKIIFVNDPHIAEHILKDNIANYPKDNFYNMIEHVIGKNILTTNDLDYWNEHRKLMAGLFHHQSIQNMFDDINQTAQNYINVIQAQKRINMNQFCTSMTLEVITKLMFGSNIGQGQIEQLAHHIDYFTNLLVNQRKLWALPFIPKLSSKFNRRQKEFNSTLMNIMSNCQGLDTDNFITRMQQHLNQQNHALFSSKELISEAALILFAGHETTATALMWTLITLSKFPSIRQQIREEINQVCHDGLVTMEHLMKMPLLDHLIKEVLRLYPPFPAVPRVCLQTDEVMGYTIPAKATVILNIAGIHRNPDYWSEPHSFDPERFVEKLPHKFSFLPFLNGPRICIGLNLAMLELKAMLVNLLQNFDLDLLPGEEPQPKHVVSLQTQSPVFMSITNLI